jgi:hypothetical protein
MLVLLPLGALLAIFLLMLGRTAVPGREPADWRGAFLVSAIGWGLLVTLSSEALGIVHGLSQVWLAVFWAAVLLVAGRGAIKRDLIRPAVRALESTWQTTTRLERALLGGLIVISATLLLIGWVSPPNNVDSLLYHMSRVVHWAQNRSLEHYATAYDHQLLKPIWAETAILHLRILWGNDQPAELVQWFSMVGSLVGVSAIAALLGASRAGQILAAAFAASIPMGILQASSTQNDYAAAFWVVCLGYFVVLSKRRPLDRVELIGLGATFGLGMLTKGTFYVYSPPLMLWYFAPLALRQGLRRATGQALIVLVIGILINLGFWTRNIITYGGPFGTNDWLQANLTLRFLPDAGLPFLDSSQLPTTTTSPAGPDRQASDGQTGADPSQRVGHVAFTQSVSDNPPVRPRPAILVALDAPLRNVAAQEVPSWIINRLTGLIALNFVTPIAAINDLVIRSMAIFPSIFDPDLLDRMSEVAWNHEDTASNPLHILLVPVSLIGLALSWRGPRPILALGYGVAILAGYALVGLAIGHGTITWGLRYQLPFFIAWSPVAGRALDAIRRAKVASGITGLLLLASAPWLLLNNTRPVIGLPPWPTRIQSIFRTPAVEVLFVSIPELQEHLIATAETVEETGCQRIGLRLDSSDSEYVIWWLLDAPQNGTRLGSLSASPMTERYVDWDLDPCAIVCTRCQGRTSLHGLPLKTDYSGISVFVGENFQVGEDE